MASTTPQRQPFASPYYDEQGNPNFLPNPYKVADTTPQKPGVGQQAASVGQGYLTYRGVDSLLGTGASSAASSESTAAPLLSDIMTPSATSGATSAAAPAAPTVPGGGFGTYAPGAALALGTYLGNNYANKQGGATDAVWNAANALNPFNAGLSAAREVGNVASGGHLSTGAQVALAVPTAGASFLVNPVADMFDSRYRANKEERQGVVEFLKGNNLLDENGQMRLSSGAAWTIDPSGNTRHGPNDNFSWEATPDKLQQYGQVVGALDPLSYLIAGQKMDKGSETAMTGWFLNLATSAGDPMQNVQELYKNTGWDYAHARAYIENSPDLAPDIKNAYINGLDYAFGVGAYANGANPGAKPVPVQGSAAFAPSSPAQKPVQTQAVKKIQSPGKMIQTPGSAIKSPQQIIQDTMAGFAKWSPGSLAEGTSFWNPGENFTPITKSVTSEQGKDMQAKGYLPRLFPALG